MNAEGFLHANNFMLRCAFAFRQLLQRHVAVLPHLFCGIPIFELRHDVSLSHWVPGRIIPASPSGLEFGRVQFCHMDLSSAHQIPSAETMAFANVRHVQDRHLPF